VLSVLVRIEEPIYTSVRIMRLALVTAGSRGDVQPILALALGLKRAGHDVRVVSHGNFAPLAAEYGVEFHATRGDARAIVESEEGKALLRQKNPIRVWNAMMELATPYAREFAEVSLRACDGVDAVGFSGVSMFFGLSASEKLGLPCFGALPVPTAATREFPHPLLSSGPSWLPGFNRLSYRLANWVMWRGFRGLMNRLRSEIAGLPPYPRGGPFPRLMAAGMPVLCGVSPSVLPRPADWPASHELTGYWFVDEPQGWSPPPALEAFLAAGPPPVCIGFGSMSTRDPQRDARVVAEALARAGQRGVILSGWAGLHHDELPPTVFATESVPHGWLYPRCAAVVHHGGAGTTAAALRAGVPNVAVTFNFDQPFWGERVRSLGCGPTPIRHRALSARRLASAMAAMSGPGMRERARVLGERIRAEDGPGAAARFLERALAAYVPRRALN
jgi:UDP:flavonoid glycosyltransferase YjiC (YdhE family)